MLTHLLWPNGVWDEEEPRRNEQAKATTRSELLQLLRELLPRPTPYMLGHQRFEEGLYVVVASFQFARLNRNLLMGVLDLATSHILPELTQQVTPAAPPR
jgi:hypothetical protein